MAKEQTPSYSTYSAEIGILQHSDNVPDQLRMFDIELKATGAGIVVRYTHAAILDASTNWPDWASFLSDLPGLVVQLDGLRKKCSWRHPNGRPKRPRVELSVNAPREERNSGGDLIWKKAKKCFYIFRLNPKGNANTAFQYSTSFHPFSYGEKSYNLEDVFVNPTLIYPSRAICTAMSGSRPPHSPASMAGFLFDYEAVTMSDPDDFVYRFNMHVEIESKPNGTRPSDPNHYFNFIPIIIDPDVGHPGGTLPPPP